MAQNSYDRIIENAEQNARQPIGQLNLQGSFLEKWLMPGQVQEREFGQQIALEKLQYEQSIDYKRQMEEMKKAGINPNLAASGISQSGSVESSPSVPSSQPAMSPSDIGNLASGLAGSAASIGDAVQKLSSFREFKENLRTQSIANLEKAGLDHWSAVSIAETLPNIKDNQRADFYMKLANIKKIGQEYENLKANHDNILAEYDAIIARKDLDISQQQYFDALKGKIKEETEWQKMQNDFFEAYNFSSSDPLDVSLRNSVLAQHYDEASTIGDVVLSYNDNAKEGEQRAVARNAYDISKSVKSGENASDVLYGRVGSWADAIGRASQIIGTNFDNVVNGVADSLKGLSNVKKGKVIRDELTLILNNAYDQLDKFPEDSERINTLINDIQQALSLSNKDLIQWYEHTNK